jgi:hypothetical protein
MPYRWCSSYKFLMPSRSQWVTVMCLLFILQESITDMRSESPRDSLPVIVYFDVEPIGCVLFLVPAYGAYFIIYSFVFDVSNLKSVICCDEPCVVPSLTGEPCFTAFFRCLVFFGHCIFVLKTKCSECQSWSLANTEIDVLISGQNRRNIWLYNSELVCAPFSIQLHIQV